MMTTICALFASMFFAFVNSPLASTNDYKFTEPVHPWFVKGLLLGTAPVVPCQLRGEDQVYMFEAFTEIDALRNASGNSFTKVAGIDPPVPSKFTRGISNRGVRPFCDIYNIVDSKTLYKKNATLLSNPTNIILHRAGGVQMYDYAVDSIKYSNASPTNDPCNVNLGAMPPGVTNIRAMVATNVACFYKTLKTIRGFGKDYNAQNSTNQHTYTGQCFYKTCYYNSYDGTFYYENHHTYPELSRSGGGYSLETITKNGIAQRIYNGSSVQSSPLPRDEEYEFYQNDPCTCTLFTNAYATASQLTSIKCWLICFCRVTDYTRIWKNPHDPGDTSYETNATIAAECQAEFFEENGIVKARVTPNYETVFNQLFGNGGVPSIHMPVIKSLPPPTNAFESDESDTKENVSSMWVYIDPRKAAFVIGVNWHTGFQSIE